MASTSAGASGMNAYEILGVQSAATTDEIKRAYKKLALQLHPDKVSRTTKTDAERDEARVRFRNVANAYEVQG
jgi:DnaJ-class molecular chaperone